MTRSSNISDPPRTFTVGPVAWRGDAVVTTARIDFFVAEVFALVPVFHWKKPHGAACFGRRHAQNVFPLFVPSFLTIFSLHGSPHTQAGAVFGSLTRHAISDASDAMAKALLFSFTVLSRYASRRSTSKYFIPSVPSPRTCNSAFRETMFKRFRCSGPGSAEGEVRLSFGGGGEDSD